MKKSIALICLLAALLLTGCTAPAASSAAPGSSETPGSSAAPVSSAAESHEPLALRQDPERMRTTVVRDAYIDRSGAIHYRPGFAETWAAQSPEFFARLPEGATGVRHLAQEEAALIDGAGFFQVFIKIILPVSLPTMATVALYAAVGQWNAWYDTMFYTNKKSLQTLSSVLMRIVRENNLGDMNSELTSDMENRSFNPEGIKMATMVVSVLPIIFIYPFLQKYFVKGIMVGSIKG